MASDKCGCLPIKMPTAWNCTLPATRNMTSTGACGIQFVGGGVRNAAFPLGCPAYFSLGGTTSPVLYPVLDGGDILEATVWESEVQSFPASGSEVAFTFFWRLTIEDGTPWLLEQVTDSHPDPSYPATIVFRNIHYHTGESLGPSVVHLAQETDKYVINRWKNRGILCGMNIDGSVIAHAPFTRYRWAELEINFMGSITTAQASIDRVWVGALWKVQDPAWGLWRSGPFVRTDNPVEGRFFSIGPNALDTRSHGILFSVNCTTAQVEACVASDTSGGSDPFIRRAKVALGGQDWYENLPVTLELDAVTTVTILSMSVDEP